MTSLTIVGYTAMTMKNNKNNNTKDNGEDNDKKIVSMATMTLAKRKHLKL
jgi:hypothetical protein